MCLFASVAHADISRISPQSFAFGNGEEFITIYGDSLQGNVATYVRFDGPAGEFLLEATTVTAFEIITFIPGEIAVTPGEHSLWVHAQDDNGTRILGPATFTVGPAPPPQDPPLVFTPEVVIAEADSARGAIVTYDVVAMNTDGSPLDAICEPASGHNFGIGPSLVICSATNSFGTTTASFFVFVGDFTSPVLTLPDDITTANPTVTFTATAVDNIDGPVDVVCDPASGSTFPGGETTVNCSALDAHLNYVAGSFKVTVTGGAPVLTVPDNFYVVGTLADGAAVTYNVSATEGGVVTCAPTSGSQFAYGNTTVDCTATNAVGSVSASFLVSVIDTTPPTLHMPANRTVEADTPDGSIVNYTVTATDLGDGDNVTVFCTPASGTLFAPGTTTVFCTAEDSSFRITNGSFTVTVVVDFTPPELSLPADITAEATSPAGAVVTYTATATDNVDGSVPVTCSQASGSTFALGTTTVDCSASDAAGNTSIGSFDVTVVDTTPPTITLAEVNPTTLWPPNHKMTNIVVRIVALDAVDPAPVSRIVSISSNQPINGTGDGDTDIDWIITGALTAQLRAERSSGKERIYTITVETTDASGNDVTSTLTVKVTDSKKRAS